MVDNSFLQSVKKSGDLFKKAKVRAHFNNEISLPKGYVEQLRNESYHRQWELYNQNHWYHIKLEDQSLILFKEDSFSFIMAPFSKMETILEYEDRYRQELFDDGYDESDIEELCEDIDNQYQNYIDTELKIGSYTPVRYDYHPKQYNKIYHPVAHLHIGHDNDSRIPLKKIMTPFAFSGFILATFYPNIWKKLREENVISDLDYSAMNQSLLNIQQLHNEKWCAYEEEHRFFLI